LAQAHWQTLLASAAQLSALPLSLSSFVQVHNSTMASMMARSAVNMFTLQRPRTGGDSTGLGMAIIAIIGIRIII